MERKTGKSGFTLLELIITVGILLILGAIGFLSLLNYNQSARDSQRIADMNSMNKSLTLFALKAGKFPEPDSYEHVSYSGGVKLWKKGSFSGGVLQQVGTISHLPVDPKNNSLIGYATTLNNKEFQLYMELEDDRYLSMIPKAQAKKTYPKLIGNFNGVYVVDELGNYYATPSLFTDVLDIGTGATFYMNNGMIEDFEVQPILDPFQEPITVANVDENYSNFSRSLLQIYTGSIVKQGGVYKAIKGLNKNDDVELGEFAKAVLRRDLGKKYVQVTNPEEIEVDDPLGFITIIFSEEDNAVYQCDLCN